MKIIIIDDEPLARTLIKEYLQPYTGVDIVQECNDGFEGLKAIQQHNPDLVFLDVQMPKLNGFEMLELLDTTPNVIFTTAFDEYALKAFEASAIDYLLKPFSKDRFDKAFRKFTTQAANTQGFEHLIGDSSEHPDSGSRIVVKVNGNIRIIPVQDVMYIESYDDYVKIHTRDSQLVKKKTMSFYENALNKKEFVRIHRSYILNLAFLTRLEQIDKDSYCAILKDNTRLVMSRSGYSLLKQQLGI